MMVSSPANVSLTAMVMHTERLEHIKLDHQHHQTPAIITLGVILTNIHVAQFIYSQRVEPNKCLHVLVIQIQHII